MLRINASARSKHLGAIFAVDMSNWLCMRVTVSNIDMRTYKMNKSYRVSLFIFDFHNNNCNKKILCLVVLISSLLTVKSNFSILEMCALAKI